MQNVKIILSFFISLIPINFLKIFLYNFFLSYKIDLNSKIGFANIIMCEKVIMLNSRIGNFNLIQINEIKLNDSKISNFNIIKNFNLLDAKFNSEIGSYNKIFGEDFKNGKLLIKKALFTTSHTININNEFIVNEDVVFGGIKSKINIGKSNQKTFIGKNVYFGSTVFLCSGLTICDKVLVGSGTSVCENINQSGLYVSNTINKIN